jgi:hypothetical protein
MSVLWRHLATVAAIALALLAAAARLIADGRALERASEDPAFCTSFIQTKPHLFSNVPVFLPSEALAEMGKIAAAIEEVTRLPAYRAAVLSWAPEIAQQEHGPLGAFRGYDFHLDDDGPKLIEINTNAGGAFLNALLARAQLACCAEIEGAIEASRVGDFEVEVVRMFGTSGIASAAIRPFPALPSSTTTQRSSISIPNSCWPVSYS